MRITPKHGAVSPWQLSAPPSSQLYETKTMYGFENSEPPPERPKSATIGAPRTLKCPGCGSVGCGPSHSHCTPGTNTPGTASREQPSSKSPDGPTSHGRHSFVVVSHQKSPGHSPSVHGPGGGMHSL